jgi:hypothetical protein
MDVPLEVVAETLGHASIRVTKDVYGHLLPCSRARDAEAMREMLFDDSVHSGITRWPLAYGAYDCAGRP